MAKKEANTYISKHGFSVSYPKEWNLVEDEYELQVLKREPNKVSFDIYDGRGNDFQFGCHFLESPSDKEARKLLSSGKNIKETLTNIAKRSNYMAGINSSKELNINNGYGYLFSGDSKQNPGKDIILALIYMKNAGTLLIVKEEVEVDGKLFNSVIKGIKIM